MLGVLDGLAAEAAQATMLEVRADLMQQRVGLSKPTLIELMI